MPYQTMVPLSVKQSIVQTVDLVFSLLYTQIASHAVAVVLHKQMNDSFIILLFIERRARSRHVRVIFVRDD